MARRMERIATPDRTQRLLDALGLATRAGRIRIGVEAVDRSIRRGEAHAVVVAGDAPARVQRRIESLLRSTRVPYKVVLDGDRLGRAVGRDRVVALALTDRSLGDKVVELASAVAGSVRRRV